MSTRVAVVRTLTGYAAAATAVALPWPLLLVMTWDAWGGLAAGLVAGARMAPYVLLSWAVGTLGDRVRRDRLVLATLVARLALLTGVAAALATDGLLLAVVLAALAVACGTPAYPAVAAAVPGLAGEHRARATDALVTIEVAAWVVGPAVGGLLLLPATRSWVPVLAVALMVLALVLAVGIRLPSPPARERSVATVGGMLRVVAGDPRVVGALGVAGLLNVVGSAVAVALLPLTHEAWGQGDAGFGVATAWLGFGALGAPLLWWVRGSDDRRQRWGLGALGLATVWVGLAPTPVLALPLLALAGAVSVLVESSVTQVIQASVPDEHRAGALGLGDSVMVTGALLGSMLAPVLASAGGPRLTFALGAGACLGTAAATTWPLRPASVQARRPMRASSRDWREAPSTTSTGDLSTSSYAGGRVGPRPRRAGVRR